MGFELPTPAGSSEKFLSFNPELLRPAFRLRTCIKQRTYERKAYISGRRSEEVGMSITYEALLAALRKGLRNGNWRRLSRLERALYRASLWYARRRRIVSTVLAGKLSELIERLKETPSLRIFKKGFKRAVELLERCEGIRWLFPLRNWLGDPNYIFWLGTAPG